MDQIGKNGTTFVREWSSRPFMLSCHFDQRGNLMHIKFSILVFIGIISAGQPAEN